VPHPRLHERRFVLAPLLEIAPNLVHPVLNRTIRDLAASLEDRERAELVETDWYRPRMPDGSPAR
jgi:2-amino-4-hydroxy-6-hydroxymethyldihydropteridine diphosphokinase